MSFDALPPPVEPPPNCRHRLLWRLARALWAAHRPDRVGFCVVAECQLTNELSPCLFVDMAEQGMRTACGAAEDGSAPWIAVVRARIIAGEIDSSDAAAEVRWLHRNRPQAGG